MSDILKIKGRMQELNFKGGTQLNCSILKFKGRIEATSIQTFQDAFEEQIRKNQLNVVCDLSGVEYITSTGLGGLVKYHNLIVEKKGTFSILAPSETVLSVIDLLGLLDVIPVFDDLEDLLNNFWKKRENKKVSQEEELTAQQRLAIIRASAAAGKVPQQTLNHDAQFITLIVVPEINLFAIIVNDMLKKHGIAVEIKTDAEEAFKRTAKGDVALLIVDNLLQHHEALCRNIKSNPITSTSSILMIHPEGTNAEVADKLTILPNAAIIEPFAIDKLAALAQSEIERKKNEERYIIHELQFRLPSNQNAISQANTLMEKVLQHPFGKNKEAYLAIKASVREAIDNANRHGNLEDESKSIDVTYIQDREKTSISVKDCGDGFDHSNIMESVKGKDTNELAERRDFESLGGLGIALMLKSSDELHYNKSGNEVTQVKYI